MVNVREALREPSDQDENFQRFPATVTVAGTVSPDLRPTAVSADPLTESPAQPTFAPTDVDKLRVCNLKWSDRRM